MTHAELVNRAKRWLYNSVGCCVVLSECGMAEMPDAIGWRTYRGVSILIECKTSVQDYYQDNRKRWRQCDELGMGVIRYYLTPKKLRDPNRIREGWGLLEVRGQMIKIIVKAPTVASRQEIGARMELGLIINNLHRLLYAHTNHFENGDGI